MFIYVPLPIYSEIPQTDIQQKFCLCMLSTITQLTLTLQLMPVSYEIIFHTQV